MARSLGRWLRTIGSKSSRHFAAELCEITCGAAELLSPKSWLTKLAALYGWERASLFCRLSGTTDLFLLASFGPPPLRTVWNFNHPFFVWLEEVKQPISVNELTADGRRETIREEALKFFVEVGADFCLPLFWCGLVGVLAVSSSRGGKRRWRRHAEEISLAAAALAGHQQAASEMERLRRELALWDSTRRQFLSRMTDELKTPLNSVIGLADALASGLDGSLTEEQVGHLSMIRASGEELLGLVNRLLDLGSLEAEGSTLHVKKVNLARLIQDLMADLSLRHGLGHWKVSLEPTLPGIYVDEEKIERVLATLLAGTLPLQPGLSGSLKAERKGDMVELTIRGVETHPSLDMVVVQRIVALHGGSLLPDHSEAGRTGVKLSLPTKPTGVG